MKNEELIELNEVELNSKVLILTFLLSKREFEIWRNTHNVGTSEDFSWCTMPVPNSMRLNTRSVRNNWDIYFLIEHTVI